MARTPDQIAGLFYERFKSDEKQAHSTKHDDANVTIFLQAGRLSRKQVAWLEGVYRRANRGSGRSECTGQIEGVTGYWTLTIYPNGAGLMKVFSW